MSSDQEKRPLSSSSWTGLPEPTSPGMLGEHYQPPASTIQQHKVKMTVLLFSAGWLLYGAWFIFLAFHSPTSPSPATGHTELWSFVRTYRSSFYLTKIEKWISVFLLVTLYLLAGGYHVWDALRRRLDTEQRGSGLSLTEVAVIPSDDSPFRAEFDGCGVRSDGVTGLTRGQPRTLVPKRANPTLLAMP